MKEIKLTKGKVALIDDADFEKISKYTWCASETTTKGIFYAKTYINLRPVYMHRMLMGIADRNIFVDHIDRNTLNNQSNNLRKCTRGQNRCNSATQGTIDSRYRGVTKAGTRWRSLISINGKQKELGKFNTEMEAAIAYNLAATKQYGEFATLNNITQLN